MGRNSSEATKGSSARKVLLLFVLLLAFGGTDSAEASHTDNRAPFLPKFADNRYHTHRSIECTNADFLHFNHFMHFTMLQDYNPTALQTIELSPACASYGTHDDVIWYATAASNMETTGAAGETGCMRSAGSDKCDRWRIKVDQAMRVNGVSWATKWNVFCHEVGHTVGFRDGGTAGTSCMDGGDNGILGQYEIDKINLRYQ